MKSLKEIREHLHGNGYSQDAIGKICGFLMGTGSVSADCVLKIKHGNHTFEDFLVWFTIDNYISLEDIECGDYVHVCDGNDVIVLTLLKNGKYFVGSNGEEVGCYVWGEDSRMCTDEELAVVMDRMHNNCLDFDYPSGHLIPMVDNQDD